MPKNNISHKGLTDNVEIINDLMNLSMMNQKINMNLIKDQIKSENFEQSLKNQKQKTIMDISKLSLDKSVIKGY